METKRKATKRPKATKWFKAAKRIKLELSEESKEVEVKDDKSVRLKDIDMAKQELKDVNKLHVLGLYYMSCFFSQQVVELALKGLYNSHFAKKMEFKWHDLPFRLDLVASKLKKPEELKEPVKSLNPYFLSTRYSEKLPRSTDAIPAEYYTETDSKQAIKSASAVLQAVESVIYS